MVTSAVDHAPLDGMRPLSRDLYVPAGDIGLWQGALRDPAEDAHAEVGSAIEARQPISVELLYSDQLGGQMTISRFMLVPAGEDRWLASVGRHWYLDQTAPR